MSNKKLNSLVAPIRPPNIISGLRTFLVAIFNFLESPRSPLFAQYEHSIGKYREPWKIKLFSKAYSGI